MVRTRVPLLWVLVLCFAMPTVSAAGDGDLTGSLEAFRVLSTADGEQFAPAGEAQPRDVIEYRLTYRNQGKDALRNVLITDPIPAGTEYVGESATAPTWARVAFSIDNGKTYKTWPIHLVRTDEDGNEVVTEATPDMVTHIRWMVADAFAPSKTVTLSYRTLIK